MSATTEYEGLVLAHDQDDAASLEPHSVMGVTQTSRTLVNATPVRPIRSALDLGCGSGLFAMLAAGRADHVVATDLNPRACEYVQENAARNGFTNIEARVGSLFEPVGDDRFDLITSNLPFVVSPDTDYVFRDGGLGGDEISRLAVSEAPNHLTDGGVAVVTASWAVRGDESWRDTVAGWVGPLDCDAWVLGGATQTPEDYIHRWNAALLSDDPGGYATTRQRWLDYYSDEGIRELCYGVIVLQRRVGATRWQRIDTQATSPTSGGGAQVDRALRHGPRFADMTAAVVEQAAVSLVAPHRLNQRLDFGEDGYSAMAATMVLEATCGVTGTVEPLTAQVLLRLDGETPLGPLIDEAVAATGISRAEIARPALDNIRTLVESGLLDVH